MCLSMTYTLYVVERLEVEPGGSQHHAARIGDEGADLVSLGLDDDLLIQVV